MEAVKSRFKKKPRAFPLMAPHCSTFKIQLLNRLQSRNCVTFKVVCHVLQVTVLTVPLTRVFTGVRAAGIAHGCSAVDEQLKAKRSFSQETKNSVWGPTRITNHVLLNSEGVLVHKGKHFDAEAPVVSRVLEPRGAVNRDHRGQVTVVVVGTPRANQSAGLSVRTTCTTFVPAHQWDTNQPVATSPVDQQVPLRQAGGTGGGGGPAVPQVQGDVGVGAFHHVHLDVNGLPQHLADGIVLWGVEGVVGHLLCGHDSSLVSRNARAS